MPSAPTVPAADSATETKTIKIEILRDAGVTRFKFNVHPAIVAIYAAQAQEQRESVNWPGLKFHYVPGIIESEAYQALLGNYRLFDNFGQKIYNNRKFNIAWLRTVGGKGEIIIPEQITIAELSELCKTTTSFIKEYFEAYHRSCRIVGEVRIEI